MTSRPVSAPRRADPHAQRFALRERLPYRPERHHHRACDPCGDEIGVYVRIEGLGIVGILMKRFLASWLWMLAVTLSVAGVASADDHRRVALIVANGDYVNGGSLKNPVGDAGLIEDALKKAGFQVVETEANLGTGGFNHALRAFSAQAAGAEAAVIYYAGHGIEAQGANWLLPVDVTLQNPADLEYEAIPIERVLRATQGAKMRMVVLDACRDNPFGKSRGWSSETRAVQGGLAELKVDDVLVIYSAAAGEKALDGAGANSPFAEALAKRLPEPGMEIHMLGSKVRDDVLRMTTARQRPYVSASISGDTFYFVQGNVTVNVTPNAPPAPQMAGPGKTQVSLDDLASQNAALAARWEARQKAMQGDFDKVAAFQGPPELRRAAWDRFLAAYDEKNPYSNEDDRLRSEAAKARAAIRDLPKTVVGVAPPATVSGAITGAVFRDCADVCPRMVKIPPGQFMMGSPATEPGRFTNEGPVHQVSIGYAFAVSQSPITFAQWDACVAENGCGGYRPGDHRWGRANRPVINVNWDDAQAYVRWLSGKTGRTYRLLSEAEYEYANRAGTATAYWWGDKGGGGHAVCDGCGSQWDKRQTAPVGSFPPNPFGLYDTTGNVWLWTQDCYAWSYSGTPSDGAANASGDCGRRVLRGGSWYDFPSALRSAVRGPAPAGSRGSFYGFRVARTY